jgi:GDP-L-fucose synthase
MQGIKGANILVTGAAGFIGTNLIDRLVDMGANVTGTIYKRYPQVSNPSVRYLRVDLTKMEDCISACKGQDYIFMCAANSSGANVMENSPLSHLTPNVVMNSQMLAAAYEQEVKKFTFISSNTVYPLTDFPVKENDVNYKFYKSYHIVAWMKIFSEEMCSMYSDHIKHPMKTLIVRPANLYGPYDKYNRSESKVIAALIRRVADNENPLEVWGNGNDIKDFLYIDDFIDALLKLFSLDADTGPVNISSGKSVTIKDVIKALVEISEQNGVVVNFDITKPSMIPIRLISNDYIKELVDWVPETTLYEGLKKTFNWYKEFYDGKRLD